MTETEPQRQKHPDSRVEACAPARAAAFDEVPGETEAEAAREAFLRRVGTGAGPPALDHNARAGQMLRLQSQLGNQHVQRMIDRERAERDHSGRLVGASQPEMLAAVTGGSETGGPLPAPPRDNLQAFFGAPLDDVRVHTDSNAAALANDLD